MLDKSVAIAFVNALLEVASKKGQFEQIEKDLDLVCDIITRYGNFKKTLFHPSIARDDKKKLIKNIFGEPVSDLMRNFLYLLVDRRKERILEFIPEIYKTATDEKRGIVKAKVQTVIPLTGDRLNSFKRQLDKFTGKTTEIEVVHNPNILGGLVIQIGNKIIDGSVVSRLKNLEARLLSLQTA